MHPITVKTSKKDQLLTALVLILHCVVLFLTILVLVTPNAMFGNESGLATLKLNGTALDVYLAGTTATSIEATSNTSLATTTLSSIIPTQMSSSIATSATTSDTSMTMSPTSATTSTTLSSLSASVATNTGLAARNAPMQLNSSQPQQIAEIGAADNNSPLRLDRLRRRHISPHHRDAQSVSFRRYQRN